MKTKAAFLASIVLLSLLGLGIYESTRERHVFAEISPQAVEAPAPAAGPVLQDSSRAAALNVPQLADEKAGVDRGHQIRTGAVQDTLTGLPIRGASVQN